MVEKTLQPLKSHPYISLFTLLAIVSIIVALVVIGSRSIENKSSIQHEFWSSKGISSYRIDVTTLALPVLPIGRSLFIQDGKITQDNIISCESPSTEHPAHYCDTIRRYYSGTGQYTLEELFDIADQCTRRTQNIIVICPAFHTSHFQGFSSSDELFDAAKTCEKYLQSSDVLCFVEYDVDYGYPKTIAQYMPQVLDGWVVISVKDFQVVQ